MWDITTRIGDTYMPHVCLFTWHQHHVDFKTLCFVFSFAQHARRTIFRVFRFFLSYQRNSAHHFFRNANNLFFCFFFFSSYDRKRLGVPGNISFTSYSAFDICVNVYISVRIVCTMYRYKSVWYSDDFSARPSNEKRNSTDSSDNDRDFEILFGERRRKSNASRKSVTAGELRCFFFRSFTKFCTRDKSVGYRRFTREKQSKEF